MLHENRSRATSFGSDPDLYHRSRPTYPDAMVDDLMADHPRDVLDVGCGTGIASRLFLDRGCRVLGVEIDDRMAGYAREGGLEVEVSGFEEWEPRGRTFDLVISGQAWHWIEPVGGAVVAARVLGPDGRIALFWNRAVHPPEVQAAFDAVYRREVPELAAGSIVLGHGTGNRFAVTADGLRASGRFHPSEERRYRRTLTYSTAGWLDQIRTHSDHQILAPDARERLLSAVGALLEGWGGEVTTGYETIVITATRL